MSRRRPDRRLTVHGRSTSPGNSGHFPSEVPLRYWNSGARYLVPTPLFAPTTPHELTGALHAAGALRHGDVAGVQVSGLIRTTVSSLRFLEVRYGAGAAPSLPERLMLKCPLERSADRERVGSESVFYREIAPTLPSPPIARCLATAPRESEQQWLLLEDLRSSHACPPWPERPSDQEVRGAVAVLAQLHCRWWDASGNLLPAAEERAEQAELAAERERQRRIEAELRIQALEARLRELEGE